MIFLQTAVGSILSDTVTSKEQVAAMLENLLSVVIVDNLDASDGLAAAVCHSFQKSVGSEAAKSHNSWKSFIQENPGRIALK